MDIKNNCGKPVDEINYSYLKERNIMKKLSIGSLSLGIMLSQKKSNDFIKYLELIQSYQKKMNITAIKNDSDIIDKHFIDSLSSVRFINQEIKKNSPNIKLIDIGSGAGFPGIPIKIYYPGIKLDLLEAKKNKKIFLDAAVSSLKLENVNVFQERAEKLGKLKEHRENYHIVLSRAVASLGILSEYCLPLCRIGGVMIAFKGSSFFEELKQSYKVLEKLGGSLESINFIKAPNFEHIRIILVIRKISPTPGNYPRRNGIPQKRPLCF